MLTSATLIASPGTITVLLGRNGAGKSTLLKIAAGWLAPDYGVVIFKGARTIRPRLAALAREGLFYLPERDLLCPSLTLRQHLHALAARFPQARDGSEDALHRLGLEARADQPVASLSGGERRRAELAVAVARRPDCLLADEPFQGVAPTDIELIASCLRELARQGAGVVVTGHEVPVLLDIADQVIWQSAGTTHYLGAPSGARKQEQFVREYLGPGSARVS